MTKEEINNRLSSLTDEELKGYARAMSRHEYARRKEELKRNALMSKARKAIELGLEPAKPVRMSKKNQKAGE